MIINLIKKMKFVCRLLFLEAILLFIFISGTFAQPANVTIEECQKWAVAQSSTYHQKELNEQLLKIKLNDVSSHLYPTLEINGQISYQSQTLALPDELGDFEELSKDQYRYALDFSQIVFDGTKMIFGRKYERLRNKAEIYKLDLEVNQIKEKIISLYLNLLILEKQIVILDNVEKDLADQIQRLKILYKEGVIYGNAVAQLELEALKLEQQKGEIQASRQSLISSLSILTGEDLSNATFAVPQLHDIEENTQSSRLEFDIFKNQMASLDYQRKLHFSRSLPSVSLFATAGYGRPTYNLLDNDFGWFYKVGIRFKVPLIDWAKTTGVGNIINLQKSIVEAQQSDFEKANKIAIQEKLNEINKIKKLLELDTKITEKYKDITQTFSTQLLNGTITAYDFIRHQNDEVQSLMNHEIHSFQLLKAQYELLSLKGKL